MLRLVSSVVLVLLVCEGEAQLRQHDIHPCFLDAGDSNAKEFGILEVKPVNGKNVLKKSVEKEVRFPEESKSFDRPITFMYVFDYTCSWSGDSRKNYAQITSGGIGERHVTIKFTIPEESSYDFLVSIRG